MKACRKLEITPKGVFLNGQEIEDCVSVDVSNINMTKRAEVVLHVLVDEVQIDFKPLWTLNELCQKG